MSRRQDQLLDLVSTPPKYATPNYAEIGLSTRVYVPEDGTLGWLILQGEALAWYSAASAAHLGYGLRRYIEREIRDGALDATPARTVWERILSVTLHTPPASTHLGDVLTEIQDHFAASPSPAGSD